MTLRNLLSFSNQLANHDFLQEGGVVCGVARDIIQVRGLCEKVSIGYHVVIQMTRTKARAEVIRIEEEFVWIKPFDDTIQPVLGDAVFVIGELSFKPDESWRGRVINALAEPLDNLGVLPQGSEEYFANKYAEPAMVRERVDTPLHTGVKIIDIFTPLCFGQRIGIFAGSGVGKSTLLAMISQTDVFDVVVLALTGERGREVRDMLDGVLERRRDNIITVVSTGDESPMMRRLAPMTATSIAEYFADKGKRVLLIVDSITRYALGAREIAISAQEPPVARGYPPSVFSQISRLLERAGPGTQPGGSITGVYSVLIDGDDHNDPVADAIRGILDGHIVLDRNIAAQGRFPAVNINSSISRLANESWSVEQKQLVQNFKEMISLYEETRDLRAMGVYKAGGDLLLDKAVELVPLIYQALQQDIDTPKLEDPYAAIAQKLRHE